MSDDITIHELMRLGHVRRWHIVATSREQTVADHTARVLLLMEHICGIMKVEPGVNMYRLALWHDVPEIIRGDPPTPTKPHMMKDWDRGISKVHDYLQADMLGASGATIVKFADLMESWDWISIHGVGAHAWFVAKGALAAAEKFCAESNTHYPRLPWMTTFLRIRDELKEGHTQ